MENIIASEYPENPEYRFSTNEPFPETVSFVGD
jgi:hypothetical protein